MALALPYEKSFTREGVEVDLGAAIREKTAEREKTAGFTGKGVDVDLGAVLTSNTFASKPVF